MQGFLYRVCSTVLYRSNTQLWCYGGTSASDPGLTVHVNNIEPNTVSSLTTDSLRIQKFFLRNIICGGFTVPVFYLFNQRTNDTGVNNSTCKPTVWQKPIRRKKDIRIYYRLWTRLLVRRIHFYYFPSNLGRGISCNALWSSKLTKPRAKHLVGSSLCNINILPQATL